jgi:hypothetical protein
MTRVPPGGTAYFDADPDEDTIEMVLTPADVRLLARAAEEQQRAASVAEPTPPPPATDSILSSMPSQTTSTHNSASLARGALAGIAAGLVIVVAIASLSTTRLTSAAKPNPTPETHKLVAASPAPAPAPTAAPATSEPSQAAVAQAQPLRFKNPFDKSEVFEFPAGTTLEEARASVADLLKQRAQDRHIRPGLQHSHINGARAARQAIPSGGAAARRPAKQADIAQNLKRG